MVQGAGVRGRASLRVVHKNILDFIDTAQGRPIRNINLNTSGIRLATETRFVAAFGQRNGRHGKSINIYLQFDGFNERTHREIRGRDLREIKHRALTNSHVIDLVTAQRQDWFREDDFFPVPGCFPTYRSITYLLTQGTPGRPDFGVVPIPRLIQVEGYLDYVSNRVVPDYAVREALEKLWSASAFMIVMQDFQDPYTLNVKQLMKCCVVEIIPDGRLIPFCAYNCVGY
ncbi:MAG: hypothetical protein WCF33_24875 [Pseudonocardiaceae bacterium]